MNTKTLVKAAIVLAVVLAFTGPAVAVPVKVEIPKEGWSIAFDSPSLSKQQESRDDGEYAFMANSGRFNLSLFVEKPGGAGQTHRDCHDFYWSQAKRNPMIAQDSVQSLGDAELRARASTTSSRSSRVSPSGSGRFTNYFVYRGKWVDVHISVIVPTKEDEEIFAAFDRSLRYG
jgi:hypothetical protein